jgi:hypothetical protein
VIQLIGEQITTSTVRTDPILSLQKEKEGKFDMAAEEAAIAQQMAALNQAMGVPSQPP